MVKGMILKCWPTLNPHLLAVSLSLEMYTDGSGRHKPRLCCEMELEACHSDPGGNKVGWDDVLINVAIEEFSVFLFTSSSFLSKVA